MASREARTGFVGSFPWQVYVTIVRQMVEIIGNGIVCGSADYEGDTLNTRGVGVDFQVSRIPSWFGA